MHDDSEQVYIIHMKIMYLKKKKKKRTVQAEHSGQPNTNLGLFA